MSLIACIFIRSDNKNSIRAILKINLIMNTLFQVFLLISLCAVYAHANWCLKHCTEQKCSKHDLNSDGKCRCSECEPSDPHWCENGCTKKGCLAADKSSGGCKCTSCGYDVKGCGFPFTYHGTTYHSCIEVGSDGRPWCSQTAGAYRGHWQYCEKVPDNGKWCQTGCAKKQCNKHALVNGECKCMDCELTNEEKKRKEDECKSYCADNKCKTHELSSKGECKCISCSPKESDAEKYKLQCKATCSEQKCTGFSYDNSSGKCRCTSCGAADLEKSKKQCEDYCVENNCAESAYVHPKCNCSKCKKA